MSIAEDPTQFVDNDRFASVARLSMAAAAVKEMVYPRRINLWRDERDQDGQRVYLSVNEIMKEYERRHRNDEFDSKHFANVELLVQGGLFATSFASPSTTMGKLAMKVGSKAADKGTSAVIRELQEHGYAETSAWLQGQLTKWQAGAAHVDPEAVRLFSPAQRRKFLEDSLDVKSLLDGAVSERDKPIMREMALRALDDKLRQGLAIDAEYDAEQDAAIAANARQIAAVSATLSEFMDQTASELAGIVDVQTELTQQVGELTQRVDRNTEDIDFLQKFMFEKMDPAEQSAALKSGFFAGMSDGERARIEAKIAVVEKQQKLLTAVSTYAQGAATVARIADRLGVDKNVVDVIQTTAQIASVATAVATGFMTGGLGYLAAADAVTGLLFGGGGEDAGAARHEQVMQALSTISNQVEEVRQMVVEVQKGIDLVLQNQQQLHNDLVALSEQIAKDHRQTLEVLTAIRQDLDALKDIGDDILTTDIGACSVFRNRLTSDGFGDLEAVPFATLCSTFQDYGQQGLQGLKDRLSDPIKRGGYHLSRYARAGSANEALRNMYDTLYDFLSAHVVGDRLDEFLPALAMPVSTLAAVAGKREAIGSKPVEWDDIFYMRRSWELRGDAAEELLSTEMLAEHADLLMFCHPFFECRDALVAKDLEKFCSLDGSSEEGRFLLQTAIDLVKNAIIQHVLLSGDVLLEDLDRIWRNGADLGSPRDGETEMVAQSRATPWVRLLPILSKQRLLRHNLVLHAVRRQVEEGGTLLAYSVAYAVERDAAYLREILPEARFPLEWVSPAAQSDGAAASSPDASTAGWHLKLGNDLHPLPSPAELAAGRLMVSPALSAMLSLRGRLSGELAGYLVPASLPQRLRFDLRAAALDVASPSRNTRNAV